MSHKLNIIGTLTHRALSICSSSNLSAELQKIRRIFEENGYPSSIVNDQIHRKMSQFNTVKTFGPLKKPMYLRLPYMGPTSEQMIKNVRECVKNTFYSVNFRVVMTTRTVLPIIKKDALPTYAKSNVSTNLPASAVKALTLEDATEDLKIE